jgi:hypothetical protein
MNVVLYLRLAAHDLSVALAGGVRHARAAFDLVGLPLTRRTRVPRP